MNDGRKEKIRSFLAETEASKAVAPLDDRASGRALGLLLLAIGLVGLAMWIGYAWDVDIEQCGGVLGGSPQGGVGESVGPAALIGLVLGLTAGAVAFRLRRRLGLVFWAFVASYVIGLILLAEAVAPAIWGPMRCVGGL
jgi:hypothetical protein